MKKLEKHLGSLVGKKVALLGLAFKPDTDDMREATSLVLASRLQGEGASVSGYDPVAEGPAQELLPSVELCDSAGAGSRGRRRGDPGHRVARVRRAGLGVARGADGQPAADRRAQLPRSREAARRRLRLRGDRAAERRRRAPATPRRSRRREIAAADAGPGPGGRRGHPVAPPDAHPSEAGLAAGRPPVHPLHRRLAGPASGLRGGDGVRLWRRPSARGARGGRRAGAPHPLRRGSRAAGHRGAASPGRRRGAARRSLPGPQRRPAERPRSQRA